MKNLIVLLALLFSTSAVASTGGAHGIPWDVKFQAMNLAIFLGILVYFAGPKVKAHFKQRSEDFHRVARETAIAKKTLDEKKADVLRLTQQLRETSAQSLAQAKIDAEKAMQEQIAKANEEVSRMMGDANAQLKSDYAKLMEKLRLEALEMSIKAAEKKLETLNASEKSKINAGFAGRVEGASV